MNVPITVAELIEMLEKFPQDAVIVNNNKVLSMVIPNINVQFEDIA